MSCDSAPLRAGRAAKFRKTTDRTYSHFPNNAPYDVIIAPPTLESGRVLVLVSLCSVHVFTSADLRRRRERGVMSIERYASSDSLGTASLCSQGSAGELATGTLRILLVGGLAVCVFK